MMKKLTIVKSTLALAVLSMVFSACSLVDPICIDATGPVEADTLALASFTKIDSRDVANVYLRSGATQEIIVEGEQEVLDAAEVRVDNGTLIVEIDGCFRGNMTFDVFVTVPPAQALEKVEVSGASDLETQDSMAIADGFEFRVSGAGDADFVALNPVQLATVKISGSGNADLVLSADDLETDISGSGDMKLKGSGTSFTADISGSGDLKSYNYQSVDVSVKASGAGDAEVFVNGGILDVTISGASTVLYKGTPSSVNSNISGAGSLIDAN
ncbi:MAG: head GIN domain-containing protein [Bacteroidota bacterium]